MRRRRRRRYVMDRQRSKNENIHYGCGNKQARLKSSSFIKRQCGIKLAAMARYGMKTAAWRRQMRGGARQT